MDGLIAYALSKKYADEVGRSILDAGLKTQVEQDRSILQTTGQEKILYFIPKTVASPSDGYDEYVYSNNAWEQVGVTDVELSSYATKVEVGNLNNLPTTDKSSIVSAISETFTSVSNGKSLVASAITDKGISTSSDATFEIMAQNIEAIQSSSDFDMTVTANQVKMIIEVFDFDLSFWTRFAIGGGGTVTVDWGDEAIEEFTGDSVDLGDTPQRKHNYNKSGEYLVTVTIENGTLTIGTINDMCALSEGALSTKINSQDMTRKMYGYKLKALAYGDDIIVESGLKNTSYFKLFSEVWFSMTYALVDRIIIKNGVNILKSYWFGGTSAYSIKVPSSVTRIEQYAFSNCLVRIIDFTDFQLNENNELPFTVFGDGAFRGSVSTILLFATQEIAEVAKITTNLSQYASRIKYVGEV